MRPGAIILANLDIDDPIGGPATTDRNTILDALKDSVINAGNDLSETTLFKIRKPTAAVPTAPSVALQLDAADANRVRVFQVAGTAPGTWNVRLGPGVNQFVLLNSASPWAFDFRIEALTLPGDPTLPGPGGASPNKPDPFTATLPTGSTGAPIYVLRAPGEVWVELINPAVGMAASAPRDVAVFTIAPFLLLSNLQPAEKVYVCDIPNFVVNLPSGPETVEGNFPFVTDLEEITTLAGVTLVKIPLADCHQPNPNGVVDVGGNVVEVGDQWAQDEFEMGYCWAPQQWMHMVLHCRRAAAGQGLWRFVRRRMAEAQVGLYVGVNGPLNDAVDFGGNLEVSPPIGAATSALGAALAGPAVDAHPAAPFGKIILGDSNARQVHANFRNFLQAQKAQPVLPLDTSWLEVGHVDEFMIFVKATQTSGDGTGGKGWVMLIAWADLAIRLLQGAQAAGGGTTNLFRSRLDSPTIPLPATRTGLTVAAVLALYQPFTANAQSPLDRTTHVFQNKLDVILGRMRSGLNMTESDFIRLPTLFKVGAPTAAFTPGMVNLLPLGTQLVIPKPWGPRVSIADATTIMTGMYGITPTMINAANLASLQNEFYWARHGETLAEIAGFFGVGLADVQPVGVGGVAGGTVNVAWKKMQIMETNIDLFEAYAAVKLRNLGLTVHFVDDWDTYHAQDGEIHCGTNSLRTPPELTGSARRWWAAYPQLAKVTPYAP